MSKFLRFSMISLGLLMVLLWRAGMAEASCGAWSLISSVNPPGDDTLFGVAAISTSNVWAVGASNQSSVAQTLAEQWNGSSWKVVATPNTGLAPYGNKLLAVTAVSASNVWAVGYAYNSPLRTLTEHYDGSTWSVVASPSPGSADNKLISVAGVSANDIWAVGYSSTNNSSSKTLVEHFNGTRWSVVSSPDPGPVSGYNYLRGVIALSANNIWAVGNYSTSAGTRTLITHWNGTHWSLVASPNPGTNNLLDGVAAVSANNMWAVGDYSTSTGTNTLTERWDGTSWSVVASPNPAGSTSNIFSGVAVVSANDIWAVGQFGNSGGGGSVRNALTSTPSPQTLIERWNGSSWSVVASLNPGSGGDSLNAVAGVPASSQAWTVGAYNNGTPPVQTLTEFYC